MKSFVEFLEEKLGGQSRQDLYHFTDSKIIPTIMGSGFIAQRDHTKKDHPVTSGWVSLTRNKDLWFGNSDARITLDADKLRSRFKIEPVADLVGSRPPVYKSGVKYGSPTELERAYWEQEERAKGPIPVSYIKKIEITNEAYKRLKDSIERHKGMIKDLDALDPDKLHPKKRANLPGFKKSARENLEGHLEILKKVSRVNKTKREYTRSYPKI